MKIEDILYKIDELSDQLNSSNQSIQELLQIVSYFQLDWGKGDGEFSNNYSVGATKPIILSGLAHHNHKFKSESILFAKNEITKFLNNAFAEKRKIDVDFLVHLHNFIIDDNSILRKEKVYSNDKVISSKVFTDPENIKLEIQQLNEWLNDEYQINALHPVILSSLFHYKFVKIHPFLDGNGRIARILTSMILLQKNLPPPIINAEDRVSYITSVRNADSGDIKPFIVFLGSKIIESQMLLLKLASDV